MADREDSPEIDPGDVWLAELAPAIAAERDEVLRTLIGQAKAETLEAMGDQLGATDQIERLVFPSSAPDD